MKHAVAGPNISYAQFALTQAEAFQYKKEDTNSAKTQKFAIGTALTTTAFLAAIVETTISALLAVLTSPAYLFAPKHYAQITQHTADSAKTILEAASRTFRAQKKQAEVPPPQIQPTRVENLRGLAKAYASSALQYSKEHKLMIAVALGTATLATAVLLYYMTSTPPSNPPISLLHRRVTHNPFLGICYPDENPEMFCSASILTNPPAGISLDQVPAALVEPAAEHVQRSIPPLMDNTSVCFPGQISEAIFHNRSFSPTIPAVAQPLAPIYTPPYLHNPFWGICRPGENQEVFCSKADFIPSATRASAKAYSYTLSDDAIQSIFLYSACTFVVSCGAKFLNQRFLEPKK